MYPRIRCEPLAYYAVVFFLLLHGAPYNVDVMYRWRVSWLQQLIMIYENGGGGILEE